MSEVRFWLPLSAGEIIKLLRTRAKMTRSQLAKKAGVTPALIAELESDQGDPLLSQLIAIGEVFGYHFRFKIVPNEPPSAQMPPEVGA